jgi:hypothetical protein
LSLSRFVLDGFLNRALDGREIREIVSVGPRKNFSFVLTGECEVQLRKVKPFGTLRGQRDLLSGETLFPYLQQARGPQKFYDPSDGSELPRIRLYSEESVPFRVQRERAICFLFPTVTLKIFDATTRKPLPANVEFNGVASSGSVVRYQVRQKFGIGEVVVRAENYQEYRDFLRFPPFVREIFLEPIPFFFKHTLSSILYCGRFKTPFTAITFTRTQQDLSQELLKAVLGDKSDRCGGIPASVNYKMVRTTETGPFWPDWVYV